MNFFCEKIIIQITLHLLAIFYLYSVYSIYFFRIQRFSSICSRRRCATQLILMLFSLLRKIFFVVAGKQWSGLSCVIFCLLSKEIRRRWEKFFSSTSTILNFDKMSLSSPFFKLFSSSMLCSFRFSLSFPFTLVCEQKLALLLRFYIRNDKVFNVLVVCA